MRKNNAMKYRNYFAFTLLLYACWLWAQPQAKRALFLGNSYTQYNNLPNMIAQAAASVGDELIFDSNTPGGQTLQGHYNNSTSMSKIAQGNWDFVVLQEQSQYPSFPEGQVQNSVYPYAALLDQAINQHNPCAETVFYMTWGRKNGDQGNCPGWPPVCTYEGMDDLIRQRYQTMADINDAIVSPVGAVWRYIRQNHPDIELYVSDESHPSLAGSYAAACTFFTVLFRKDPTLITYNGGLSVEQAQTIRLAAKTVVFGNLLQWKVGAYDPVADFTYEPGTNGEYHFTNQSTYATEYLWDFGDGVTSTLSDPTHTFTAIGTYTVKLTAAHCDFESVFVQNIEVNALSHTTYEVNPMAIYQNPASDFVLLKTAEEWLGQSYHLYDQSGRKLLSGVLTHTEQTLHTPNLSHGIYFITLGTNQKVVIKLVIQ